jgi:putative endonuclease
VLRRLLRLIGRIRQGSPLPRESGAGASLGRRGERIAERHLRANGLRIFERNARVGRGEIDLVALDGDTLVFVEVKCRAGREGDGFTGLENVDGRKREALRRACLLYRKRVPRAQRWRLDVVTVRIGEGGQDLRWYPGVLDLDGG